MAGEKSVQNKILAALRERGAWATKITASAYQQNGVPDILACYRGRFLGIEVKNPKGHHPVTKLQKMQLQAILEADGMSLVADNVEVVLQALAEIDAQVDRAEVASSPV